MKLAIDLMDLKKIAFLIINLMDCVRENPELKLDLEQVYELLAKKLNYPSHDHVKSLLRKFIPEAMENTLNKMQILLPETLLDIFTLMRKERVLLVRDTCNAVLGDENGI